MHRYFRLRGFSTCVFSPVSYTHLDVYKRQLEHASLPASTFAVFRWTSLVGASFAGASFVCEAPTPRTAVSNSSATSLPVRIFDVILLDVYGVGHGAVAERNDL